ncbi:MAG: hypothetical protein LUE86_13995, partial [Clostridiales bacterium]|nr:hypothetical protein [Clostridiales bacterium]
MTNDSKVQQQVLQLVAQSITEFLRFLKARREFKLFEEDYKAADELLKLQMTVEDSPEDFMVITVLSGKEDEFRRIMDDHEIKYIYANASYLEKFTGSYIIDKKDFQMIMSHKDILIHQEQPEFMEDEAELEDELGRKRPGTEDRDKVDTDEQEKQKDRPDQDDQVLVAITARYTGTDLKDAKHIPLNPDTGTYTIPNEDVTVLATYDDGYERIISSNSFKIENPEIDGNTSTYIGIVEYTENGITKTVEFRVGSERELDELDEAAEHELGESNEERDEKRSDEKGKRHTESEQSDDTSGAALAAEEAMRAADAANQAAMEQAEMIAAQAAEAASSAYQAAEAAAAAALVSETADIAVEAAETIVDTEAAVEVVEQAMHVAEEINDSDHSTDAENTAESDQPSDRYQGEPGGHVEQSEITPAYQDASFHEETYAHTEPISYSHGSDENDSYNQPENEDFSFTEEQKPASDNKPNNNNSGYERYENPTRDTAETGTIEYPGSEPGIQIDNDGSYSHDENDSASKQAEIEAYSETHAETGRQTEPVAPENTDFFFGSQEQHSYEAGSPQIGDIHGSQSVTQEPDSVTIDHPSEMTSGGEYRSESREAAESNTYQEQVIYSHQETVYTPDRPEPARPPESLTPEDTGFTFEAWSTDRTKSVEKPVYQAEDSQFNQAVVPEPPKAESREAAVAARTESPQAPEGTEFSFDAPDYSQLRTADVSDSARQTDASTAFGRPQASEPPKSESREAAGYVSQGSPLSPEGTEFFFGTQKNEQFRNLSTDQMRGNAEFGGQDVPESNAVGGIKGSGAGAFREDQEHHSFVQPQNSMPDAKTGIGSTQSGSTETQGNPFAADFSPNKQTESAVKSNDASKVSDAKGLKGSDGTQHPSDLNNTENSHPGVGIKDRPDNIRAILYS